MNSIESGVQIPKFDELKHKYDELGHDLDQVIQDSMISDEEKTRKIDEIKKHQNELLAQIREIEVND